MPGCTKHRYVLRVISVIPVIQRQRSRARGNRFNDFEMDGSRTINSETCVVSAAAVGDSFNYEMSRIPMHKIKTDY